MSGPASPNQGSDARGAAFPSDPAPSAHIPAAARVDVLIPVYNAQDTVEASVRSIQRQTLANIRIIIVNDGSTDGSGAILAGLAREDARIMLIERQNGGIVDALNQGLAHCSAQFVARHDADDLAHPTRFERQIAFLEEHPDCIAVDGLHRQIDERGIVHGVSTAMPGPVHHDSRSIPSREPYLTHPFLMVRRAALVRVDGYRYAFHSEDTDLYWRLLPLGELRHMPSIVGDYRHHQGSISSRSIVNGRVSAIFSQLAALSHERQKAGLPDLIFAKENLATLVEAARLPAMLDIAGKALSEGERHWLRLAVSAKLLELGAYRPYIIEEGDVDVIACSILRHDDLISTADRVRIDRTLVEMVIKLLANRQWKLARRLQPSWFAVVRRGVRLTARKARRIVRNREQRRASSGR